MATYSRATVAHELEGAKRTLSGLRCSKEVSHAINILFSHIEHQDYDIHDLTRGLDEIYTRLEK